MAVHDQAIEYGSDKLSAKRSTLRLGYRARDLAGRLRSDELRGGGLAPSASIHGAAIESEPL